MPQHNKPAEYVFQDAGMVISVSYPLSLCAFLDSRALIVQVIKNSLILPNTLHLKLTSKDFIQVERKASFILGHKLKLHCSAVQSILFPVNLYTIKFGKPSHIVERIELHLLRILYINGKN